MPFLRKSSCIMHIRQCARLGLLVNRFYSRGVTSNLIPALAVVLVIWFGGPAGSNLALLLNSQLVVACRVGFLIHLLV